MRGMSKLKALTGSAVAGSALVVAIAASASAATTSSPASAPSAKSPASASAPASPGRYCGRYGDGYTNENVWYKKSDSCHDFNLTWARWSGYYRGYYWTGSRWEACNSWPYHAGGQTYLQVLCSSVKTGTPMYVSHVNSRGVPTSNQGFHIHVNY